MYRQMICSLMYLTDTRPDTCFAVNALRHVRLMVARHVVRYLKGTVDYGLKYDANQKINLEGYVDSYWAGSAIDKKSTSECCFSMGSGVISWFGRMESRMALSTSEAKDVATCYLGGSMFLLKNTIWFGWSNLNFLYDAEKSSDPDWALMKEGFLT